MINVTYIGIQHIIVYCLVTINCCVIMFLDNQGVIIVVQYLAYFIAYLVC